MNIVDFLINEIEKDGIVLKDRKDVYNSLERAIDCEQFEFIRRDGKNIGFFSWEVWDSNEIFINNLFMSRQYRGRYNFLHLRSLLRDKYKNIGAFHWRSRKRNKEVTFKEKEKLC